MGLQILGKPQTQAGIPATAPSGAVGIDMLGFTQGTMRVRQWLITVVVTGGASDVFVWGDVAVGNADDPSDDVWGLHQDEYNTFPLGKIASALPIGTYHFITEGLGLYDRIYFQKSANTVDVTVREIISSEREN